MTQINEDFSASIWKSSKSRKFCEVLFWQQNILLLKPKFKVQTCGSQNFKSALSRKYFLIQKNPSIIKSIAFKSQRSIYLGGHFMNRCFQNSDFAQIVLTHLCPQKIGQCVQNHFSLGSFPFFPFQNSVSRLKRISDVTFIWTILAAYRDTQHPVHGLLVNRWITIYWNNFLWDRALDTLLVSVSLILLDVFVQ